MKHTKGEWMVGYGETLQFGRVFGVGVDTKPNWTPSCVLSFSDEDNGEDLANARLIVKSPELYDLIKYILEKGTCYLNAIERSKGDCDFEEWGEKAKELIKQIEGGKE